MSRAVNIGTSAPRPFPSTYRRALLWLLKQKIKGPCDGSYLRATTDIIRGCRRVGVHLGRRSVGRYLGACSSSADGTAQPKGARRHVDDAFLRELNATRQICRGRQPYPE